MVFSRLAFASRLAAKAICFSRQGGPARRAGGRAARGAIVLVVLTSLLALPMSAAAQGTGDPLQAAAAWLRTQQQPDGGFSNGFAPGSDPATTADAVLAIVAAGEQVSAWTAGGASPLEFLHNSVATGLVAGPGAFAKVALAAAAAGENPRAFGGVDLVQEILGGYSQEAGLFGSGPYDSALAIQALIAAGAPLPEGAVTGLLATRLTDGSYSFNGDLTPGAGDSNTTAMVVLALAAAGEKAEIAPSVAYFRSAQNEDGGWTYQKPSAFGEATDANSTALVLEALVTAGEDLQAWNDPVRALLAFQAPSGAFIFNTAMSSENLLATVQAMPALAMATNEGAGSANVPWTTMAVLAAAVLAVAVAAWLIVRPRVQARASG